MSDYYQIFIPQEFFFVRAIIIINAPPGQADIYCGE